MPLRLRQNTPCSTRCRTTSSARCRPTRPSKTDSTTTLDAGRYQIETNIVAYTYNDDCIGGTCTTTKQWYGAGSTNLRIGLTQASDFQIIVDAYRDLTVSDKTAGTRDESNGFGDTLLRYKYNFFGNDGGEWALAGLAFVKLPTNQDNLGNDDVEAGFELPFNWNFAEGWSFGGMTQVNLLRDSAPGGSDYYGGYVNSLIVTRSFTEKWSGYGELWTFKTDYQPALAKHGGFRGYLCGE